MKTMSLKKTLSANNYLYLKVGLYLTVFFLLIVAYQHAFATDLLAGTDTDMKDTIAGTGKKWLYWIDGGAALLMFTQRKNFINLISVLGVAVFINVLIVLAS